jgi:hypothetical protein
VAAVAGALEAGATTVGARVELDHLAPSPVGTDLEVKAMLERVAGRWQVPPRRRSAGGRRPHHPVVVDTVAFLPDAGAGAAR